MNIQNYLISKLTCLVDLHSYDKSVGIVGMAAWSCRCRVAGKGEKHATGTPHKENCVGWEPEVVKKEDRCF